MDIKYSRALHPPFFPLTEIALDGERKEPRKIILDES